MELGERALVLGVVHLRVDERNDLTVRDMGIEIHEKLYDASVDLRADLNLLDRGDGAGRLDGLDDIRPGDRGQTELRPLLLGELLGAARHRSHHGQCRENDRRLQDHCFCSSMI